MRRGDKERERRVATRGDRGDRPTRDRAPRREEEVE